MPHAYSQYARPTDINVMPKLTRTKAALALMLASPIPFLVPNPPLIIELASHFAPHLFVVSLLVALLVLQQHPKLVALSLLPILFHTYTLAPTYWPLANNKNTTAGAELKIIHSNVLTTNQHYEALIKLIEHHQPDVFTLQESNSAWLDGIKNLEATYRYSFKRPSDDNFGIALYSKYPFTSAQELQLGSAGLASIKATLDIEGQNVTILSTHPLPPVNAPLFKARNTQLHDIAHHAKTIKEATILIGDLNTTPWSYYFKTVETDSGLRNARRGFGILPTWPSKMKLIGIPIDHIMVREGVHVRAI